MDQFCNIIHCEICVLKKIINDNHDDENNELFFISGSAKQQSQNVFHLLGNKMYMYVYSYTKATFVYGRV